MTRKQLIVYNIGMIWLAMATIFLILDRDITVPLIISQIWLVAALQTGKQ